MRRAWVAVAAAVVLLGLVTWGVGSWGDAPALGAKLSPLLDSLLTPALEPAAAILRDAAPAKPATPGIIDANK